MKIKKLGLRTAVVNRLADNGINNVEQLEQMSDTQVLSVCGLGLRSLREIRKALRLVGKDFRQTDWGG